MKQAAIRKFSSTRLPSSPTMESSNTHGKKMSVPGPTSVAHFMSLLLYSTFRKPMSVNPSTKAGVYLCAAAGGSLLFDFFRAPPSYFSYKYNLLNQVFVKWGWGWTFVTLAPFIVSTSFVYSGTNVNLMRAHILRILAGTGCWYTITGLFNYILDATGRCHPSSVTLTDGQRPWRRTLCHRAGGNWVGFDISGHCFLLTMANLWIIEELRCMQYWVRLSEILKPYEQPPITAKLIQASGSGVRNLNIEQLCHMRSAFKRLTGSIRLLFSLTSCLSMLWDFMFLMTIVYFHSMPSKFLGTVFGVGCWFLFYHLIFPAAKSGDWAGYAPGMPGDGPIEFVPRG